MQVAQNTTSSANPSYEATLRRLQAQGPVQNAREDMNLVHQALQSTDSFLPTTGIKSIDKTGQLMKFSSEAVTETTRSVFKGGSIGALCGALIGALALNVQLAKAKNLVYFAMFPLVGGVIGSASRAYQTTRAKTKEFMKLARQ